MSWLVVGVGAAAALAGLVIPLCKFIKGRAYDNAVLEYRICKWNRDNKDLLFRPDERRYWDVMAKRAAARARGLYPLRADQDLQQLEK